MITHLLIAQVLPHITEDEAKEFKRVNEEYRCFGHYPESILGDKIYRITQNRFFC